MATDVLLGIIALATLTTAVAELLVLVWLVRAARRSLLAMERLHRQALLLRGHVDAIGGNLSRALSLAGTQLDRVASAYSVIAGPVERVARLVAIARGVSAVLARRSSVRPRRAPIQAPRIKD